MAKAPPTTQPTDPGVGQPQPRQSDILLVEIAKLQNDGEYLKRDIGELRSDMKDVRDRLSRLEERVTHLPSKGFIVAVVTTALLIAGGLLTIVPRLQTWANVQPSIKSSP